MRRLWKALRRRYQVKSVGLAASHARHHYEISFQSLSVHSSTIRCNIFYFRDLENDTLEPAQQNNLIQAKSKLQLKTGMTVAEIGPGWGGFPPAIIVLCAGHMGVPASGGVPYPTDFRWL